MTPFRKPVEWVAPLGAPGHVADALLLKRHMRKLITTRGMHIKRAVEGMEGAAAERKSSDV